MKISIKQQIFADEYILSGNATKAAIKAGYNKKYAATNISKLLNNTNIKEYISNRLKELEKNSIAKQEEVLKALTSILRSDYSKNTDKIRAAELLMKKYNMFSTEEDQNKDININITLED